MSGSGRKLAEFADQHPPEAEALVSRIASMESSSRSLRLENKALRQRLARLERLEAAKEVVADHSVNISKIGGPRKKGKKREATAVMLLSDVHAGEDVDPSTINYLNEYNPTICRKSVDHFMETSAELIDKHRHGVTIRNIVLWWGGDIMTGWLHEDQQETNNLTPPEEVGFCIDMLASGLSFLTGLEGLDRIDVVANVGNHGRGTVKPRHGNRVRTSWERLLYDEAIKAVKGRRWEEAKRFDSEPRIHYHQPRGKLNYIRVYDMLCRATHGDDIGYGGGVGGISIPINKQVKAWNEGIHADLTWMGHFHNEHNLPRAVVNGSVIGPSSYSERFGHEKAKQSFFLLDSRHGKTTFESVVCRGWKK